MKETKEEYLNFDGMASEVPNDMPWGDTHWSGMSGTEWQQDGFGGTNWQDVNLNAAGDWRPTLMNPTYGSAKGGRTSFHDPMPYRSSNAISATVGPSRGSDAYNVTAPAYSRGSDAYNVTAPSYSRRSDGSVKTASPADNYSNFLPSNTGGQPSITLDHHLNKRPNIDLVLGDNDNSTMPDSDQWSNHPGFIGGTWWQDFWAPRKAEAKRAAAARESIDSRFPITGSCDILTATEGKIQRELDGHAGASKRGPKRVAKRNIPILKKKLSTVSSNRAIQCDSEAEDQIQDDQLDLFMQQQMQQPDAKEGVSATNVILGLVIIGGLIWGISRLAKPTAPVAVAVAPAPAPAAAPVG